MIAWINPWVSKLFLLQLLGIANILLKKAMIPLMLLVAITKKVTHLGTIAWDLFIWRINLCVKSSGTDVFTIMLPNYEKKMV